MLRRGRGCWKFGQKRYVVCRCSLADILNVYSLLATLGKIPYLNLCTFSITNAWILNPIEHVTVHYLPDIVIKRFNHISWGKHSKKKLWFIVQFSSLRDFLQNRPEGRSILTHYEKHGELSNSMRNELVRLILLEGLNLKLTLDSKFHSLMTGKIVELFPGEKQVRRCICRQCC